MSSFLDKLKQTAVNKLKEHSLPIPITSAMLEYALSKAPLDDIKQIAVQFIDDHIVISGKVKKMLMTVSFSITLKPVRAEGRKLIVEVVHFSPADFEIIKKKVLNHPPAIGYGNGDAWIDLNEIDSVKAVQYGEIRSIEIKENKLWARIGLGNHE